MISSLYYSFKMSECCLSTLYLAVCPSTLDLAVCPSTVDLAVGNCFII